MFGSPKPVVLSYGARRQRWRPPRWLVLLLSGIVIGAAGLWFVQERYLPPRLSASETARLRGCSSSDCKDPTGRPTAQIRSGDQQARSADVA